MQLQALVFTPLAQPGSRSLVCDALVARQYRMREVRDVAGLLESVQSRAADVIVLGAGPGCNWAGIDLAREVRRMDRRCPLILLTADSSEEFSIAAFRARVTDLFRQTASAQEAAACVDRVTALFQTQPASTGASRDGGRMVGTSPGMCLTRERIHQVAATDTNVLITGETGTGKELVAELIHHGSRRQARPFVSINCAAIPEGLLESELFGHERGAFTGAHVAREGKLQFAQGGTVFLDEIGDMDLHSQAKILRAIESRRVQRLGGHRDVAIDVRLIAATNQDLENLTAQGRFRKDLYFRLNVARVHLEPLRQLDSTYAALYYPWVTVLDPVTRAEINLPPSGFVCGIYARNDITRAVYKAPANEVVNLAIGFEALLNKAQKDVLNPLGVNYFRPFEGRGFRLWDARTIASGPEWKYVNLRRYIAYLEHSIDKGTQWAVFEPNGDQLWANVRRTVSDFLLNEWQTGALLGDKPEKAYFVRCDRSTMTQDDLDNGRLVCLIGVAPLRPAEYVIFRIGQWTADSKS